MKKALFLVLLAGFISPAQAEITGMPTVISGDILMVNGVRMHLHGIDAPELDQVCLAKGKNYRCGAVARTASCRRDLGDLQSEGK